MARKCSYCGELNKGNICTKCGFDSSCDIIDMPTLLCPTEITVLKYENQRINAENKLLRNKNAAVGWKRFISPKRKVPVIPMIAMVMLPVMMFLLEAPKEMYYVTALYCLALLFSLVFGWKYLATIAGFCVGFLNGTAIGSYYLFELFYFYFNWEWDTAEHIVFIIITVAAVVTSISAGNYAGKSCKNLNENLTGANTVPGKGGWYRFLRTINRCKIKKEPPIISIVAAIMFSALLVYLEAPVALIVLYTVVIFGYFSVYKSWK